MTEVDFRMRKKKRGEKVTKNVHHAEKGKGRNWK